MKLYDLIRTAFNESVAAAGLGVEGQDVPVILERPRDPAHGDVSTPLAMTLAKKLRTNPLEIAEKLAGSVALPADMVDQVEVVKPGFINLRFTHQVFRANLLDIISAADSYGSSNLGGGRKVQVEYVSANPTGPLVLVSARAAAVGSVLVNLLKFTGHDVAGEYYVNDHGNQIKSLGGSFRFRLRERFGQTDADEEIGAYPGDYLRDMAGALPEADARSMLEGGESDAVLGHHAAITLLEQIERDLSDFGVHIDNFFLESSLHNKAIEDTFDYVRNQGYTYEKDDARYFRSSEFGDEKDRVLRKSDGVPTYFLGDIAYHRDKLARGFERAIVLLGPDHHGHVPRMRAATGALGAGEDWLEVILVGWVRLLADGKPISMSKRAGEFIMMRELMTDVGRDVAHSFFLMRRSVGPLDFDLTLARKQSDENPVYYVQYAHARISSVVSFAREKGLSRQLDTIDLGKLTHEAERALMLHLVFFGQVIDGAALSREPHRLTTYAQELATLFHQFYHECRIVSDDQGTSAARLLLAEATMQVLRNSLCLLGVDAPQSM